MPRARNGSVEIEYQTFGDSAGEAVLLINGLGSQMTRWPEAFCALLVQRGLFAIRFDNRDTGLSTWCDGQSYNVGDMAADFNSARSNMPVGMAGLTFAYTITAHSSASAFSPAASAIPTTQ